ncbi:MAG: type II toxin-antitoxin system PemK/MazF family toxin [Lachnospiraceae bacterium]|nr:type II toxin-antitoxin system PemK/MazF family toxin [Lachnospiraceae bacterium]
MVNTVHQGDILKIENIKSPVLVTSKDFFNESRMIIGCPIIEGSKAGALHIPIDTPTVRGVVYCEQLALFDLSVRGYSAIDRIPIDDIINITDAIQGIFDYI